MNERQQAWRNVVGKRVLYRRPWATETEEAIVVEMSPSGEFVKLNDRWADAYDTRLVEILPAKEKEIA